MPQPLHRGSRYFYASPAWRAVRRLALAAGHYRCAICGVSVAHRGQARVDHIQPVRTRPDLALSLANLRVLCVKHDAEAHREKGSGSTVRDARFSGCDARGVPLDPNHHWHASR
jgi:5-methylcytosine-specific restriction endonuclease McrA